MPRYYFHFLDLKGPNLIRDSLGVSLPSAHQAKQEAIGLAQDVLRHPIQRSCWQIVVTNAAANVVLRVPLSKVRARRFEGAFDLIRRVAFYEPKLGSHVFTWFLTAAVLAIILQSLLFHGLLRRTQTGDVYRLAGEMTRVSGSGEQVCSPDQLKGVTPVRD
jgi:hypothetical protein